MDVHCNCKYQIWILQGDRHNLHVHYTSLRYSRLGTHRKKHHDHDDCNWKFNGSIWQQISGVLILRSRTYVAVCNCTLFMVIL